MCIYVHVRACVVSCFGVHVYLCAICAYSVCLCVCLSVCARMRARVCVRVRMCVPCISQRAIQHIDVTSLCTCITQATSLTLQCKHYSVDKIHIRRRISTITLRLECKAEIHKHNMK